MPSICLAVRFAVAKSQYLLDCSAAWRLPQYFTELLSSLAVIEIYTNQSLTLCKFPYLQLFDNDLPQFLP